MACFLVPAAEAVITTAAEAVLKKKEKEAEEKNENAAEEMAAGRVKFSEKLGWLNMMLWGGAILLLFEHVWHGEVVPWFPFLTAASSPESTGEMLHEMATAGVGMTVLVTVAWIAMVIVYDRFICRAPSQKEVV
ncbi:MAG: hypothetical protein IKN24_02345 [Lachnospiraceae bacterium]|nr:hypothetical protein [Lachnospiraceae bacterium]